MRDPEPGGVPAPEPSPSRMGPDWKRAGATIVFAAPEEIPRLVGVELQRDAAAEKVGLREAARTVDFDLEGRILALQQGRPVGHLAGDKNPAAGLPDVGNPNRAERAGEHDTAHCLGRSCVDALCQLTGACLEVDLAFDDVG